MKIEIMKKSECCGCTACENVCPKQAITLVQDEEGFFYPQIDKERCINCGLCENVCMFKSVNTSEYKQSYYAAKSVNLNERLESRSGGVFFVLAKKIIKNNGVVYGAIIDKEQNVIHTRAADIHGCRKMQGSKYVESDLNHVYIMIKSDLQSGRDVLFSGTACQVAGLYGYIGKAEYTGKLYTVDIVCHGVSSRKIYFDFKTFIEKKYNDKIEKFDFRDKNCGWDSHVESYIINGKKIYSRYYTRLFYANVGMRPSCSNCPFASYARPADITLADFWGLRNKYPEFDDNKGVSAVLINSIDGENLFNWVKDELEYMVVTKDMCCQPNLYRPTPIPEERREFWHLYQKGGFNAVIKKYGGYDLLRRIKWKIFDLPKLLKDMKKKDDDL